MVGSSVGVARILSAWARTVRASASKIRWLATVGAWASICRAPARVSTSWLKVTWAWPPGEASHWTAESAVAVVWVAVGVGGRCGGGVVSGGEPGQDRDGGDGCGG